VCNRPHALRAVIATTAGQHGANGGIHRTHQGGVTGGGETRQGRGEHSVTQLPKRRHRGARILQHDAQCQQRRRGADRGRHMMPQARNGRQEGTRQCGGSGRPQRCGRHGHSGIQVQRS